MLQTDLNLFIKIKNECDIVQLKKLYLDFRVNSLEKFLFNFHKSS